MISPAFLFTSCCVGCGILAPVTEHRFAAIACGGPGKGLRDRLKNAGLQDWRFDYAWPEHKVFLEVDGGAWINGRHNRGAGFLGDMRKANAATMLGWVGLRCTPDELKRTPVAIAKMVALVINNNKAR